MAGRLKRNQNEIDPALPGAKGSKPVASAVADDTRTPLMSANEPAAPVPPVQPVPPEEQPVAPEQSTPAQHPSNLAQSKVVTKQRITPTVEYEAEDSSQFDAEAEKEKMRKSAWLAELNNQVNEADKQYKEKAESASRYAKAAAWGDFFNALGQLAGRGKQTYVKPESRYLTEALAKADRARDIYEAVRRENLQKIEKAKTDYLSGQEKRFYASQEAANKAVRERNKLRQEHAKNNAAEITSEVDNSEHLKQMEINAKKALQADKTKKDEDADRRRREASAFVNYRDYDNKHNYNLNRSEALTIANVMLATGAYTEKSLGLTKSVLTGQIEIQDKDTLRGKILDFINKNRNNKEVVTILNNSADNYGFGGSDNNNEDDLK